MNLEQKVYKTRIGCAVGSLLKVHDIFQKRLSEEISSDKRIFVKSIDYLTKYVT